MIRKLLPGPVTFVLSIEIGLPFLELSWPLCLIAGIFFVLCNRITERLYKKEINYWYKFLVLTIAVPITTIIYVFIVAFENFPLRVTPLRMNILALQGLLGMAFCTMCLLLYMRCIAFFMEWWWTRFKKIKEKGKPAPAENSIRKQNSETL